jgi:hypothetical protein
LRIHQSGNEKSLPDWCILSACQLHCVTDCRKRMHFAHMKYESIQPSACRICACYRCVVSCDASKHACADMSRCQCARCTAAAGGVCVSACRICSIGQRLLDEDTRVDGPCYGVHVLRTSQIRLLQTQQLVSATIPCCCMAKNSEQTLIAVCCAYTLSMRIVHFSDRR